MGKLILYGIDASPPVRACMLTLKALDLPYEYKQVNLLTLEHLSKEYLAKNPQHTVPTLEDDGHFIWDSHAIMAYLVRKYGKTDALYPKDHLKRAVVDQRLHFESGVVFAGGLRNITANIFLNKDGNVPQSKIDNIVAVYDFLETFLKDHSYIAGDQVTIADFSIATTLGNLSVFKSVDASKYPKITSWLKRLEQLPYYKEINESGVKQFAGAMKSMNMQIVP